MSIKTNCIKCGKEYELFDRKISWIDNDNYVCVACKWPHRGYWIERND